MSSILDQLNDLPAPDSGQPNESPASMPPPTQLPPIQSTARRQRKKRRTKAPAPDSTSDTVQLVQESPRSLETLSPRPVDALPQEQVNESFQMTEDVPPLMKQSSKSVRFDETLERTEYLPRQNIYPDSANLGEEPAQNIDMGNLDGIDRGMPIPAGAPPQILNEPAEIPEDVPVDVRYQTLLAKHAPVETKKVHKPNSVKDYGRPNNVNPTEGHLYVQTKTGFQAKAPGDNTRPMDNHGRMPAFATPETTHKQGEGLLTIIRNFARFSLGLSAGIALIGALGNQFSVHFHREAREALYVTVSALITFATFGTLCNVDPLGIGGLTRLIRFDPASLSNIALLIALMISAVGDCLYETAKLEAVEALPDSQNATQVPDFEDSDGFIIVEWIRASLLLLSWAAMSFSDAPGGALYQRIKKQNEI
ncbi:Oidioi.mRNA.OKI2018_I69.chr2.g8047.t1.cds [Oikopleura dioica]|uniref:Oidioi.mRNA.OKI2018_I69.chr2.g8047.t1.cds n=1 Tax=Oikopleura dioica TaxID=34765 RepID=A0ABN7TDT3_OIKDI|nr:Oidioi.mRNA.OKI2018_I69.chr2.g8047.t1.cds [Oikopleura dioica]